MTPAARAVEAGARALDSTYDDTSEWMRERLRADAAGVIAAALGALAADPATAGLCAADLAAEMEMEVERG